MFDRTLEQELVAKNSSHLSNLPGPVLYRIQYQVKGADVQSLGYSQI